MPVANYRPVKQPGKPKTELAPSTIYLPPDVWDRIDAIASRYVTARSVFVRQMVMTRLEQIERIEGENAKGRGVDDAAA